MEYCGGATLRKIIEDNELKNPSFFFDIVRGCFLGLRDIHCKNIIHRDIKPVQFPIKDFRTILS